MNPSHARSASTSKSVDNLSVFMPNNNPQIIYAQQPQKKCCSRKCCFIGTALGVFFGLLILGTIIYVVMVVESQCYRGCQRVCTTEHKCLDNCWKVCWKAQWTKCPEDGAKACGYILWDKTVINVGGFFKRLGKK